MFSNLKITLRSLAINKIYTIVNMVGLVIGIVSALYIFLWIDDELSYDKFHKKGEDIYLCVNYWENSLTSRNFYFDTSPMSLGPVMKESITDIESFCRTFSYSSFNFEYIKNIENNISIPSNRLRVSAVDPSFFKIFSFDVLRGNPEIFLNDDLSIILSESLVLSLFPANEDPLGKVLTDNTGRIYNVSGVFADMPGNSSINFTAIIPFSYIEKTNVSRLNNWGDFDYKTYFLMNHRFDKKDTEHLMTKVIREQRRYIDKNDDTFTTLFPIQKQHLYNLDMTPGSVLEECRLFSIIAVIILLMACINYINLVTARSSKRIKEITIRHILGAKRGKLFKFFYDETVVLFILSLAASIILLLICEPVLNQISGKNININPFSLHSIIIFFSTLLFISLIGGIYPAFILTNKYSFKASSKNRENKSREFVRRFLIITQFSIVITLVMVTMGISSQMRYMKKREMGYNPENIIYLVIPNQIKSNLTSILSQINYDPNIVDIAITSQVVNNISSSQSRTTKDGKEVIFARLNIDKNALKTLGIELITGDNYKGIQSDSLGFILNQSATQILFPRENPIGKELSHNGVKGNVIGVVKDFNHLDLKNHIRPMIISGHNEWSKNVLNIKTNGNNSSVIEHLKEIWGNYAPLIDFNYGTLEEDFEKIYRSDIRSGKLITIFSVISLIIACLGIFGLITYTAERRVKEIGIRKVLGAEIKSIVLMLSKEFIILYFIAMIIAFPLANIWLNRVLDQYTYHISISIWFYLFSALLTFIIGALTISYKAIRTAMANPIDAIRAQ